MKSQDVSYKLVFKVNKHSDETILTTNISSLAYGMKKKLSIEQAQTYPLNKLHVRIIK